MKILELFSGNGDISEAFRNQGHEVFRVDWSEKVEAELHADVSKLTLKILLSYVAVFQTLYGLHQIVLPIQLLHTGIGR